MKNRAIITIARFTFFEAMRNRLFLLTLAGLVCVLGLTEFVGELAVSEAGQFQAIVIGAGMRLFAIVTIALFVITSVVREFNDKQGLGDIALSCQSYCFTVDMFRWRICLYQSRQTDR